MQKVLTLALFSLAAAGLTLTPLTATAQASSSTRGPIKSDVQSAEPTSVKLASAAPVTYDNKYEIYGGLSYQNFQAGQNLPKLMNLGGVEVLGTYWLTNKLGLGADFRGQAGTTPVFPNPDPSRPLVVLYTGMAGAEYRGPHSQRAALNYHAFGGVMHGDFTRTANPNLNIGLYTNQTRPIFALGGSVDINRSKNFAFRLSPDLILEHYGTETREFFAISAGIVYRIGRK